MKIKVNIAVVLHATKYGSDIYIRQIKKGENVDTLCKDIAAEVDFVDDLCEDLTVDTQELIIDTEECDVVPSGTNEDKWVLAVTDV